MKSQRDVASKVKKFYLSLAKDKHHRYLSWEHCYDYFGQSKVDTDKACLHLAFYLASWGMYRGSSFLLWKDYLIHEEVVVKLLEKIHLRKVNANYSELDIDEIVELCDWVRDWYKFNVGKVNGKDKPINPTNTLVTKIILGALGCIPAYDRYFIDGLRNMEIEPLNYSREGIGTLVKFYISNKIQFDSLQAEIKTIGGRTYPAMKLIDMYFWQIGSEQDRKEEAV